MPTAKVLTMRAVSRIFIHTAATPVKSIDISAAAIKAYHLGTLGWATAGYHYVVRKTGKVEALVPVEKVSNGVKGANAHSLHICLSGNGDIEAPPKAQWDAAVELVARELRQLGLVEEFKANPMRVMGHRECHLLPGVPPTTKTCPGRKHDMTKFRQDVLKAL